MAATSHDFWLHNLSPYVWKSLHMGVYAGLRRCSCCTCCSAWCRARPQPASAGRWSAAARSLLALHVDGGAGGSAHRRRAGRTRAGASGRRRFVRVCHATRSRTRGPASSASATNASRCIATTAGSRQSARVCQHQFGPLGEGKVVDGCVVCPWHGYEYRPDTGASPPPFTEKVPTYRVRVVGGDVLVDPRPMPPGTFVEPARCTGR